MSSVNGRYNVGGIYLPQPFKVRRLGHFGFNVEKLPDERVLDAVVDDSPCSSALHDALLAEDPELLRRCRGLDLELAEEVADAHLAVAEELERAKPQRIAEGLEEPGLEAMERFSSDGRAHPRRPVFMNS